MIVGAGVSGLTTGIILAEAGLAVRVVAAETPRDTTSAVAGASWGPYMATDPRVMRWSLRSREALRPLAADPVTTGVRLVEGVDADAAAGEPPDWVRASEGFRIEAAPPAGFVTAWRYVNPLVDMPTYLGYLERRLAAAGVAVRRWRLNTLAEVRGEADIVVNCTGLQARTLLDDPSLTPTRGQLVVVKNPGVTAFFQDQEEESDLTYILPHGEVVVLGGSAIEGREDLDIDYDIADAIVERCARIDPRLREAPILAHRVGLSPNRPCVRLEYDHSMGFAVVHNYGHGGSGITLSWGCAEDVLELVRCWSGEPRRSSNVDR
jgi:D-amino-acid oxidase